MTPPEYPRVHANPQSETDMHSLIVAELAAVRALSTDELDLELVAGDGDLEVDSKEAEVILARLEVKLGCELPAVSDLEPEQLNCTSALTELVRRRVISMVIVAPEDTRNSDNTRVA